MSIGEIERMNECTDSEGTWRVTRHSPSPSPVESTPLLEDDSEDTTAAEGLRVYLTLDFEDIERKENLI